MAFKQLVAAGTSQVIDTAEVKRALAVLADPEHGVELRGLNPFHSRVVAGSDLEGLANAAKELAASNGIYYAINPIPVGDKTASKGNVLHRQWLLIDVDPVKEDKDNSATDTEKESARATMWKVFDYLDVLGWPAPVLIDSGNGFHLLYRTFMFNDAVSSALCKRLLHSLAERFDGPGATVDKSVHDAPRIAKLPGTWSRKGKDSDERPFRMCRMICSPSVIALVSAEMVEVASREVKDDEPPAASPSSITLRATDGGNDAAYGRKALDSECLRVILAPRGERNNALNRAAFSLSQLVAGGVITQEEVEVALVSAAEKCGLDVDPECGHAGIIKTIQSGFAAGTQHPRGVPEKAVPIMASATIPAEQVLTICAADIKPLKVKWLWPDRIPLDFITVFAGRTGLGKSFVTSDMIARVTKGSMVPFSEARFPVGGALFVSEDPPEYMTVPRLIELGADLRKVRFLSWEIMGSYSLADTDLLDRSCKEVGGIKVVVIDPPTNFLGDTDEHKNSEVRATLMRMVTWLKGRGIACILIMHVNKQSGKGIEALSRVLGSVAWVSTSRIAHSFAPDPDDPSKCLFVPTKNNLGILPKALKYQIVSTAELARLEWLEEVDVTADEAMNKDTAKPRRVVASEWLIEKFGERLEWPSDDLFRDAKAAGISHNAMFEAKDRLNLPKAKRVTLENGNVVWMWWVPPDWPPLQLSQDKKSIGTVGTLGTVGTQVDDW